MKALSFIIDLLFWLWLFIIPTSVLGFSGLLLYKRSSANLPYSIIIALSGIVTGIMLAEHIRKKYGLTYFFGRLIATPELDREKE